VSKRAERRASKEREAKRTQRLVKVVSEEHVGPTVSEKRRVAVAEERLRHWQEEMYEDFSSD